MGEQEASQSAARAAPTPKFAITIRHRGKEQTIDISLPSPAIEGLAIEATSRDLGMAQFIGQLLVSAIQKILR
jgi:hypothetical protein